MMPMSQNVPLSDESVQVSMGNALSQSFSEVLNMKEQVQCLGSKQLTSLIEKEVAESLRSALSTRARSEGPAVNRGPSHRILNKMTGHACKMLQSFAAKVKNLSKPRSRRQRGGESTAVKTRDSGDLNIGELAYADIHHSPVSSVRPRTSEEVSSADSGLGEKSKAVQEILSEELRAIIEPLLVGVSDSEYELLRSENCCR